MPALTYKLQFLIQQMLVVKMFQKPEFLSQTKLTNTNVGTLTLTIERLTLYSILC